MSKKLKQIDFDYWDWLIKQIRIPPNTKSYNDLFDQMHQMEFVWMVPNDDNRLQDGLDLRGEFLRGKPNTLDVEGVTFLEVLVALSRRVAFTAGGDADFWAWRLIKNLRLNKMSDPLTEANVNRIGDILYSVIWRTYQRNGQGGFFPLVHTMEDQTKVEIWYQMNAYVIEKARL